MLLEEIKKTFQNNNRDRSFLNDLGKENCDKFVQELHGLMDGMGRSCITIRKVIDAVARTNDIISHAAKSSARQDFYMRWLDISKTHLDVCNLMGFEVLFRMDATFLMIQLLSAESETERIIACKHAYTIVAEARNRDLFSALSAKMRSYPESVLPKEEYTSLWRNNKSLLKSMTKGDVANRIRNSIDSHKSSFIEQMEAYSLIDYTQCVFDMVVLIIIGQDIDGVLHRINKRIGMAINALQIEERQFLAKMEAILKQV